MSCDAVRRCRWPCTACTGRCRSVAIASCEPSSLDLRCCDTRDFAGSVINGIILLPDRKSMVFALGSTIVKRDIVNPTDQQFLQGHSDRVTCMSLSPSGKYLASGQVTHLGFQADVIVWDMESLEIVHRLRLHKVRVEAVSFSCNDKWLASIGGEDDNSLVVWNLETGKAVCGSPAANDVCHTGTHPIAFHNPRLHPSHDHARLNLICSDRRARDPSLPPFLLSLQSSGLATTSSSSSPLERARCACGTSISQTARCDRRIATSVNFNGPSTMSSSTTRTSFAMREPRVATSSRSTCAQDCSGTWGRRHG